MAGIASRSFTWAAGLVLLAGCAPPGYHDAVFTNVSWPRADQPLSIEQRIEVEGRLRALDYFSEPADGVITRGSRTAIRAFQQDIGAPANGHLSLPLLDALQTNSAFLTADELRQARSGQVVRPARAPQTGPAAAQAPEASATPGEGGAGGGAAGGWN